MWKWKKIPALAAILGLIVGSIGMSPKTAMAEELEKRTYKVGYVQDRKPVSFMDEDGELAGITRYILDRIEELSGVDFEYVALPTGSVTYDYLLGEGFDLVTSVEYNKENQAARGILMSDPYLSGRKVIVAKEGKEFSYNAHLKVAISTGSQTLKKVMSRTYPSFELVDYPSIEACLEALIDDKADLVIQNQFVVEYWLMSPTYESLQVIPIAGLDDQLCFSAVVPLEADGSEEWHQKEMLINRLNEAIHQISSDEEAMYIIEATLENKYQFNMKDILYRYRYAAVALLIALALILILAYQLLKVRIRSMEDRADARAKGRFLSTMSHEIRTPLNGLIGLNYLMSQNLSDHRKMEAYLRQSTATAKYLLSLVNDILDMSRIEEQTMELEENHVNLRLLVATAASIAKTGMDEKHIKFDMDIQLPYPSIMGDQIRIQQVLMNMLDNARKFTPEGGQVRFIADQELRDDDRVSTVFHVSDNGCGMNEEFQKKIFDMFTREQGAVSKGNQGTGLGMAISYRLAQMMGGSLSVRSEKGKGSEFTFAFPSELADGHFDGPEEEAENEDVHQPEEDGTGEAPAEDNGRIRVLVAEDNELNAEILRELLADVGFDSDLAENGREAVNRFAGSKVGTYKVILMDLLMPEMDGFEAAKAIRALKRPDASTVRIYACTANSFQEDKDRAIKCGMDDFITKPIDINSFLKKLGQVKPS